MASARAWARCAAGSDLRTWLQCALGLWTQAPDCLEQLSCDFNRKPFEVNEIHGLRVMTLVRLQVGKECG